MLVPVQQHTVP